MDLLAGACLLQHDKLDDALDRLLKVLGYSDYLHWLRALSLSRLEARNTTLI